MADVVSPQKRSEMMSGIKGKNTKPEIAFRKILHSRGFRFRLHNKDLPGKPDLVLSRYKAVIFIHGCFWHGHESCRLFRIPKSRSEFWGEKITGNIARDKSQLVLLQDNGWRILIVWECSVKGKPHLVIKAADLAEKWLKKSEAGFAEIRRDAATGLSSIQEYAEAPC